MPAEPISADLDNEKPPRYPRTFAGIRTSVTGFVGRTLRGDANAPIQCSSYADFERRCGGLWAESELGYAVSHFFQNGGAEAVISRVTTGAGTAAVALTTPGTPMRLEAASPGTWGNTLCVSVSHGTAGSVDEAAADQFHLTIMSLDETGEVAASESFEHVCVATDSPRYVERVLEEESALVRVATMSTDRPVEVSDSVFAGGTDGDVGSVDDYKSAIWRLRDARVNLLVIPPPSRTTDVEDVLLTAVTFCERCRAIMLMDPPRGWANYESAAGLEGLDSDLLCSSSTVFYYPRIVCPDPLDEDRPRTFVPSGMVAGVIARVDAQYGVWTAPEGPVARLSGVVGLADTLGEADIEALSSACVNALQVDPSAGPVIRGARTSDARWSSIRERRLLWFVVDSIVQGTRWAEFESNDELLWGELREGIGVFMDDLFHQGAFQGETASDAYFFECHASSADIQTGRVSMRVGIATVEPGKFLRYYFSQRAGRRRKSH